MPSTYAKPDLLASTSWVAENYNRPGVRVLDCRWRVDGSGRRLHAEGHVPGAVHIDWTADLGGPDDDTRYELAQPAAFAAAMLKAGVADGMTVVALDDTYSLFAARVWWSLRAYGFENVRVLDGGWPAWLDLGAPISGAATEVEPVAFSPSADASRRVSSEELAELVRTGNAQLIDARTPAEYQGHGGPGPRRGHIPGALNLPAAVLAREGSQALPSADQLERLFSQSGLAANRPAIAYDALGVGAAKVAFCLELMGWPPVAVYDAGWQEWAALPEEAYPVEGP